MNYVNSSDIIILKSKMSGHSHWSSIKRQKQSEDLKRAKLFSKVSRNIWMAVKEGKGNVDPQTNARLRLAIDQAQKINMPKGNIERAIKKAAGVGEAGGNYEKILYGGFILGKVALLIEVTTDNQRRTMAQIKNILESTGGGTMVSLDFVQTYFQRTGIIKVPRDGKTEEDCLEIGLSVEAQDVILEDEEIIFYTDSNKLVEVVEKLEAGNYEIIESLPGFRPKLESSIAEVENYEKLNRTLEEIEELEDVENVYTNLVIPIKE